MAAPIEIDGSRGEGGGQILRTSLALAVITGRPLVMKNIRARRAKPGLQPQHTACVQAAQRICDGGLEHGEVGQTELELVPQRLHGGTWEWHIGTAGSATLVLQTVMVPLLLAKERSRITIVGGTHNSAAPPYDFLAHAYLRQLRAMGARGSIQIERYGFYPAGGGRIVCEIEPSPLAAIAIEHAGAVKRRSARALISKIPMHVGEREIGVVQKDLGWRADECRVEEVSSPGPGNAIVLEIEREHVTEVMTGFGEKRVRAEAVARSAVEEVLRWQAANVPVGEHLADQLMLPMAVAGAGRFRTLPLTLHATTNLETIAKFLDVPARVEPANGGVTVVLGE